MNSLSISLWISVFVALAGCGADTPGGTGGNGGAGGSGGEPALLMINVPSTVEVEEACTGTFDLSPPFFDINDLDASEFVEFVPDGTRAIVRGILGPDDPAKVRALIENNPEVRTLVLTNVPGTIAGSAATIETARIVREANLATCVPSDGYIASGAVGLFLAGSVRLLFGPIVGGAGCMAGQPCPVCSEGVTCVGVHDWLDVEGGFSGRDLPMDDPLHQPFIDIMTDLGIDEDFYWFQQNAAPSDEIYFMSPEDLAAWGVQTNNACTATTAQAICHAPPGSFTESCSDCFLDEPTLSCNCNDVGGTPQPTSLDASACEQDIANCDGVLTCTGGCPAAPAPTGISEAA